MTLYFSIGTVKECKRVSTIAVETLSLLYNGACWKTYAIQKNYFFVSTFTILYKILAGGSSDIF